MTSLEIFLTAAAVAAIAYRFASWRRWPVATRIHTWLHQARTHIFAWMRRAPGTCIYLFIVAITTLVVRDASHAVGQLLLSQFSTNLRHLRQDPLRVLIWSAFWLPSLALVPWLALLAIANAPVERRIGTLRWLLVIAVGHIGATLASEGLLAVWIHQGVASAKLASIGDDLGVSYGLLAVGAVATFYLPKRLRLVYAGALLGFLGWRVISSGDFPDYGHLFAALLGFVMYPLVRRGRANRSY